MHIRRFISPIAFSLAACFCSPALAGKTIPSEALSLIGKVHTAATEKNFVILKSLMVKEFTWSFGGDGDSNQALSAWRNDPKYLKNLAYVTRMGCAFREGNIVEYPKNAGTGYRTGFKKLPEGWRMLYFVAGD